MPDENQKPADGHSGNDGQPQKQSDEQKTSEGPKPNPHVQAPKNRFLPESIVPQKPKPRILPDDNEGI